MLQQEWSHHHSITNHTHSHALNVKLPSTISGAQTIKVLLAGHVIDTQDTINRWLNHLVTVTGTAFFTSGFLCSGFPSNCNRVLLSVFQCISPINSICQIGWNRKIKSDTNAPIIVDTSDECIHTMPASSDQMSDIIGSVSGCK